MDHETQTTRLQQSLVPTRISTRLEPETRQAPQSPTPSGSALSTTPKPPRTYPPGSAPASPAPPQAEAAQDPNTKTPSSAKPLMTGSLGTSYKVPPAGFEPAHTAPEALSLCGQRAGQQLDQAKFSGLCPQIVQTSIAVIAVPTSREAALSGIRASSS